MKEDWPHLDILADKQALLGTDSRFKLVEAVLFDVRRRVEELSESIAAAGHRLCVVEGQVKQQKETAPSSSWSLAFGPQASQALAAAVPDSSRSIAPGKQLFPPNSSQSLSPGPDSSQSTAPGKKQHPGAIAEDNEAVHENVAALQLAVDKERMKREQEIISVQRQLDGIRDSYKRLTEMQKNQQSAVDRCSQRIERCEDMRASISMWTTAECDLRERLEEVEHNVENHFSKQRALHEEQGELADVNGKPARGVNPLLAGHVAKLSRDVAGVKDHLMSLEMCMQGPATQESGFDSPGGTDKTVVNDIRRMQLAIATISRSVSKVAKDVFDMRASDVSSRSSTASSLSSVVTQGSRPGQRPRMPNFHPSSVPENSPQVPPSPSAPCSSICSPGFRLPFARPSGSSLRPSHASDSDSASDMSTSIRSVTAQNINVDTLSTASRESRGHLSAAQLPQESRGHLSVARLAQNRTVLARGEPSGLPKYPRSATFGAKTTARSSLTEPVHDGKVSMRPMLSVRPKTAAAAHLFNRNNPEVAIEP